jgi:elongation of very long chain fatty acids protein 6
MLNPYSEFLDTFFLVIHKKPIIFLHYFHHIVTCLGSFWAYQKNPPVACIFGLVMNYGVHAVMYFYYFLMAIRCKPNFFKPIWITMGQLAQMVVGVLLVLWLFSNRKEMPTECVSSVEGMALAGLAGYLSFGLLFAKLLFGRYLKVTGEVAPKRKTS